MQKYKYKFRGRTSTNTEVVQARTSAHILLTSALHGWSGRRFWSHSERRASPSSLPYKGYWVFTLQWSSSEVELTADPIYLRRRECVKLHLHLPSVPARHVTGWPLSLLRGHMAKKPPVPTGQGVCCALERPTRIEKNTPAPSEIQLRNVLPIP
jgi:hypothetical protein